MYKKQPSTSDSLIYETSRKTFFLERRRNYGIEMKHNVFFLSELQPQHEICIITYNLFSFISINSML